MNVCGFFSGFGVAVEGWEGGGGGTMECLSKSSDWKRWRLRTISFENSRGEYWFERMGAMKAGQRRAQRVRKEGREFVAGWARESWTAAVKRGHR